MGILYGGGGYGSRVVEGRVLEKDATKWLGSTHTHALVDLHSLCNSILTRTLTSAIDDRRKEYGGRGQEGVVTRRKYRSCEPFPQKKLIYEFWEEMHSEVSLTQLLEAMGEGEGGTCIMRYVWRWVFFAPSYNDMQNRVSFRILPTNKKKRNVGT